MMKMIFQSAEAVDISFEVGEQGSAILVNELMYVKYVPRS
jgi:hypothetical protein